MRYGLSELQYNQIVKVFVHHKEVDKVILYGSRAKGTQKPYSDIDITILGDNLNFSLLQKIEIELDDLLLPYKFDVSLYNSIENNDLAEHIKRVGKTIYKKEI
jgi:predicted nucleotidyltransferase